MLGFRVCVSLQNNQNNDDDLKLKTFGLLSPKWYGIR